MADKHKTKTAYQENPAPVQTVQEKQLEDLDGNFDRKRDVHEGDLPIQEKQLDDIPVSNETGKAEFQLNKSIKDGLSDRFERQQQDDLPLPEDDSRLGEKRGNAEHDADRQVGERQLEGKDHGFDFNRWDDNQRDGGKLPLTEKQFEGKGRKDATKHQGENQG